MPKRLTSDFMQLAQGLPNAHQPLTFDCILKNTAMTHFTGNEDHRISLKAAAKLTKKHRHIAGLQAIKGEYFSKAALLAILNEPHAVGVRIYYGMDGLIPKLVLVGVTANGSDLVNGYIAEHSISCPPHCSIANELNT